MSLFSFNLLTQENPKGNTVSGQPVTPARSTVVARDEHSFKALVAEAIKNGGTPVSPAPQPAVEPKEEIVVAEQHTPAVVEKKEVAVEIEPEMNKLDVKSEDGIKSRVIRGEAKESIEADLLKDQTHGTLYLKTMLSEFSDLLSAGKDLEKMEIVRSDIGDKGAELEKERAQEKLLRDQMAGNLSKLLTSETENDSEGAGLLENVLKDYQNYLEVFEERYSKRTNNLLKDKNEILIRINKKRDDIKNLIDQVGGNDNFRKIKDVVMFCKEQRARTLKSNEDISVTIQNDVIKFVNHFVEGDLHGAVMLAQENDIVGIMMRVYSAQNLNQK